MSRFLCRFGEIITVMLPFCILRVLLDHNRVLVLSCLVSGL